MRDAPEPIKIGTPSTTAALLTKGISPLVGAGEVTASSLILPISPSILVAEGTTKLVDVVLPDDMNHLAKSVVEGGVSGGVAGATFTRVAAGQTAAVNAATTASSTLAAAGGGE
eukprot:1751129-Prymnesium_polylepis.2